MEGLWRKKLPSGEIADLSYSLAGDSKNVRDHVSIETVRVLSILIKSFYFLFITMHF